MAGQHAVYLQARRYVEGGLSVIPVRLDGSKAPACEWQEFQVRQPMDKELRGWFFEGGSGIAIIGGRVSGNLERIDFDEPGIYEEFATLCSTCGYGELLESLPLVRTPRAQDCYHLYYRCEEPVEGNQPLARRLIGNAPKAIIETRGTGGYTIAPGSPATCHPSGREYELVRGDLTEVPQIPPEDRTALLEMARSFNEIVEAPATPRQGRKDEADTAKPGDDYNARGDWRALLEGEGWRRIFTRGEAEYWRRPGKGKGVSASFNHKGSNTFYVFSSNAAPFEQDRSYFPFGIYATLRHGGDFAAAASALSAEGFGEPIVTATLIRSVPGGAAEPPEGLHKRLARYPQTDLGNAERFLARNATTIRYCPSFGKWFVWDLNRWHEDETGMVVQRAADTVRAMQDEAKTLKEEAQERLAKHARRSESDGKIGGMLNLARAWVGVSPDELDADPWLFNCLNGTLDLRTGELLSHQQGSLITKLAPFEYQPEATCPTWEAFLRQIFADCQPLIDYMQRAVGYAMTGVIREQCLFFLHGRGANGKSTFLSVIQDVLGDYARDTPTESLMIKQNEGISNDIARLKGARFVTAVETEAEKRMAESLVKRLTGGDTITARFMRQEYFQFRGTFKIFLAANHKPGVRGTDDGIWRRIKHIPFEVQIPDAEQDAELPDKLKQEAEGILAWAVRGCMAWQRQGLGEPTEVTQATAAYRDEMDWLGPFIEERCILQATQSVGAKNLYKAYLEYCESINEKSLSLSRFGRLISDRPRIVKRRSGPGGGWEYWGIGLSDSSDADIADDGENGDLGAKCSVDADGSRSKLNTLDTTEHFPLLSVSLKETHAGVIGSSVQKCSGVQLNAETHLDYDPETEMEI